MTSHPQIDAPPFWLLLIFTFVFARLCAELFWLRLRNFVPEGVEPAALRASTVWMGVTSAWPTSFIALSVQLFGPGLQLPSALVLGLVALIWLGGANLLMRYSSHLPMVGRRTKLAETVYRRNSKAIHRPW